MRNTNQLIEKARFLLQGHVLKSAFFSLLALIGFAASSQCTYTLDLRDQYSDGWSGNNIDIKVGSNVINYELSNGLADTTFNLVVNTGDSIKLTYYAVGTWPSDVSFELFGPSGSSIYFSGAGPASGVAYAAEATCPNLNCLDPSNLSANNITTSTVDLSWSEQNAATSWQLEVTLAGGGLGTGIRGVVTSNPYNASGLAADTDYEFYVRSICSATDSSNWSGPYTFSSPCIASNSYPAAEDFDNAFLPACWTENVLNGVKTWTQGTSNATGNITPVSGSSMAYFQESSYNADASELISPVYDLTSLTTPNLTFWHTQPSWFGDQDTLRVYYRTSNSSSWNLLASFDTSITVWTEYTVDLPSPSAEYSLKFEAISGYGAGVTIDDFQVREKPSCVTPSSLMSNATTSSTASLSWTENGSAVEWIIEYGVTGFTQGNGSTTLVNTNPTTSLTALTPQTTYDWYVRSICGRMDSSAWSLSGSFTTPCAAQTPNYSEDFASFLPACWDEADNGTLATGPQSLGSGSWRVQSGGAFGNSARINLYTTSRSDWLVSPAIDLTGGPFELVIDAAVTNFVSTTVGDNMGSDDSVQVAISTDNGTTWNSIYVWDVNNEPVVTMTSYTIDLSAYSNTTAIFGILATDGPVDDSEDYDFHIGNFEVRTPPSCAAPSAPTLVSVTDVSATVNWTENGTATEWQIEYGPTGFTQGAGSFMTATSQPASITGLTPQTDYEFYVRAVCAPTDSSVWSNARSFTTPCSAISPNYSEDFTTFLPNCWDQADNGTVITGPQSTGTSSWRVQSGGAFGNSARINLFTTSRSDWLISPSIDLTGGPFELVVDAAVTNYISTTVADDMGSDDSVQVVISTDNGQTWNSIYVWDVNNEPVVTMTSYRIDLSAYANTTAIFGILATDGPVDDSEDYDFHIGNFEVRIPPSCNVPSAPSLVNVTASSANIDWTENGTATTWQIIYDTTGFVVGTERDTNLTTTKPATISGLMPNTTYDWYVRSICGPGDTSVWMGPNSFQTTTLPVTVPYNQDFEGGSPLSDFSTQTGSDAGLFIDQNSNCTSPNSLHMTGGSSAGWTGSSGLTGTSATQAWVTNTTKQSSASLAVDASSVTSAGLELSFDLKQTWSYGPGYSWARVLVNGTQISPDYRPSTQNSDPCAKIVLDLSAYKGTTFNITFQFAGKYDDARGSGGVGDNAYFDNISLYSVSCPDPSALATSNITSNSADLGWTENGSATSWHVEYGLSGFNLGSGTKVVSNSNPYSLSGLITNQTYDFYVRSICSASDSSAWIGPFSFIVGAPLSGVYTIDPNTAASATNFLSFTSFSTIINTFGVSGMVTINVAPGSYNDYLELGEINGTSMTNSVTINGSDNSLVTLTHDQSTSNGTISLIGSSYIEIKNMTIEATGGTDSWGIFMTDSAHHISVDSNIISMPINTTIDIAGVMISGSSTSDASSGNNGFDISITNNRITGGEKAINFYGSSTASARNANILIENNTLYYSDDYGIYVLGYDNVSIRNNRVDSLNATGSDALYLSDVENFEVSGNFLLGLDNGFDADDLNFDNSVTVQSSIFNNMILGGDDAIYLDDCENINIFHNNTAAEDYAIYLNDHANLDIRNNIFASNSDDAFYSLDSVAIVLDYNIYVSNGTGDLIRFGGTAQSYSDLATFQAAAPSLNVNSLQGDPLYLNNTSDLHVEGNLANDAGDNSVGITTDFDGDTRPLAPSTTVDIGADEFTPPTCLTPSNLLTSNETISSIDLDWLENGTATQWEIAYGPSGFILGSGTRVIANSNPFSVTGLNSSSVYDFYVRSVCSATDSSAWTGPISGTTLCAATTAPYSQNFDGVGAAADFNNAGVPCWIAVGPGAADIEVSSTTDAAVTGSIPSAPNVIEFNDGSWPSDSSILVSPQFSDLSSGMNSITFEVAFESTSSSDGVLYVGVMSNPLNTSTFVPLDTIEPSDFTSPLNFNTYTLELNQTSLIGASEYVALAHGPGIFEIYMDNFVYDATPLPYYPIGTINTEDPVNFEADSLGVECRISGTIIGYDRFTGGYEVALVDMSSGMQEGITLFSFNDVSGYTTPTEGDSIMVWGEVDQFRGLTEFIPDSIMLIKSNATLPVPMVTNVLDESTESRLLSVTDKFVLLGPSQSGSFNLNAKSVLNPTDTIQLRIDTDSDIDDSLAIATNSWVAGDTICGMIGVGGQRNSSTSAPFDNGYQIFPNSWSDITICKKTVGIEEGKTNQILSVYPNPTTGEFTISTTGLANSNARLSIRDISGKVVLEEVISKSNQAFNKTYELDKKSKGLYFISIIDGNARYNYKLIIQ